MVRISPHLFECVMALVYWVGDALRRLQKFSRTPAMIVSFRRNAEGILSIIVGQILPNLHYADIRWSNKGQGIGTVFTVSQVLLVAGLK